MAHVTSVGLDVHARSIKACAFNPFTGVVERRSFRYSPAEVAEWVLSFEAPKAVYESGVTGFHLQRELESIHYLDRAQHGVHTPGCGTERT